MRVQQAKQGEVSATARVVKIGAAPATAEASKSDANASENGRYVAVWVPEDEETEQQAKSTNAYVPFVPFVRRVSVAEQNGSCMGAVDVEPSKYLCTISVIFPGGEELGTFSDRYRQSGAESLPTDRRAVDSVGAGDNTFGCSYVVRGNEVIILGPKTMREQVSTDIVEGSAGEGGGSR